MRKDSKTHWTKEGTNTMGSIPSIVLFGFYRLEESGAISQQEWLFYVEIQS